MTDAICPDCGTTLPAGDSLPGQAAACPSCGAVLPDAPAGYELDLPEPPAIPSASGRADRLRLVTRALAWLALFLIALIAVVFLARQVRLLVAERKATSGTVELQEHLRELQAAKSNQQRQDAARAIVALGPEAVAATLDQITSITRDKGGERILIVPPAVRALAGLGPEAAEGLGQALASPKANVRYGAAHVLRAMGSGAQGAMQPLIAALADENRFVAGLAAEALGNQGPAAAPAVQGLLPLLGHPDAAVRRQAVDALGRIGPAAGEAVPALTKARDQDPDPLVRGAADLALHHVNLPAIAAQSLARAGPELRELVKRLQSDDESSGVAAAKAIRQMGMGANRAIPSLALALQHKNKWTREAAAQALGGFGLLSSEMVPALRAAANDAEPEVRAAAEKAIGEIEGKRPNYRTNQTGENK